MNTGQMMVVMGSLAILSILSLTINAMIVTQTTSNLESEATLNAVSLAQSLMDEIMTRAYDDSMFYPSSLYSVNYPKRIWDTSGFTPTPGLGPSATENNLVPKPDSITATRIYFNSDKYYNDLDDYNGYTRVAITPVMGRFTLEVSVVYVLETNPGTTTGGKRSFFKRIMVTVRHMNMSYPFSMYDVAVYRRYF